MSAVRGQLLLDVGAAAGGAVGAPGAVRLYWECRGPGVWEQVRVRVRYGPGGGDRSVVWPDVVTGRVAPRNVLVERADGTAVVRPVRVLRVRRPR